MVRLFSHGALRYPEVQRGAFGRELTGVADTLEGFPLAMVEITGPDVLARSGESHPFVHVAAARVAGQGRLQGADTPPPSA